MIPSAEEGVDMRRKLYLRLLAGLRAKAEEEKMNLWDRIRYLIVIKWPVEWK